MESGRWAVAQVVIFLHAMQWHSYVIASRHWHASDAEAQPT